MKKFLIAGSSLAAVAAAGSAGAVDVTLGGTIDMGIKYGVGKDADAKNGFTLTDNYQSISISVAAAGTTDAGLKFGGSFGISTADELKFNPYPGTKVDTSSPWNKYAMKLVNSSADVKLRGVGYNVSGGALVKPGSMVSVKINSAWYEAGSTITAYNNATGFESIASTSAVCKLAGEVSNVTVAGNVTRGAASNVTVAKGPARAGMADAALSAKMTMDTVLGAVDVRVEAGRDVYVDATEIDADKVAMGAFMEVMMTSSTTKMVVGGVCVTHKAKKSKTAIYMDVASRVLHVSDASIYIEGGFGKLSVGTGAYGGSVAGVGSAGDQVKIDGDLNATLSSVSFLGFSGHGAVALDSINLAQRPNYAFGTSTNLLGLTVAVEMEDTQSTDGVDNDTWIDLWDAGTSYDLNGMSVAIATDSAGDWAMSLGYELLGFAASSTIENVSKGNGAKAGLNIDTSLSTSLNGVGISVGLDESLAWSIGASYTMGSSGLSMYVNYSQADGGGKIGATMSF